MLRSDDSVWYDLGRAFGYIASAWTGKTTHSAGARSRAGAGRGSRSDRARHGPPILGDATAAAIASTAASLAVSALGAWKGNRRITTGVLLRGAAAGAGAAGVVFALGRLSGIASGRNGMEAVDLVDELLDRLLSGAGRGLVYAALLDPLLPGPPPLRGALAGTADYFALPLGGLFARLQSFSPIRRIPVISALLEIGESEEDSYLAFLAYGLALGLLYGDTPPESA